MQAAGVNAVAKPQVKSTLLFLWQDKIHQVTKNI